MDNFEMVKRRKDCAVYIKEMLCVVMVGLIYRFGLDDDDG